MKKVLELIIVIFFLGFCLTASYAYEAFSGPTELRYYDKEKACVGYMLFWPWGLDGKSPVFLIDMEGNVVHTWPALVNPKFYEDGLLIGGFKELDWDGNVLWEWTEVPQVRPNMFIKHNGAQMWRIWNPKLKQHTYLGKVHITPTTQEEAVAAGCDPSKNYTRAYRAGLIEVDREFNIIWEWDFLDHVIQDRNPAWPNYVSKEKTIADYPGKLDLFHTNDLGVRNNSGEGLIRDWQHVNSIDYNPETDHIAINAKHWSEFYVIDHGATFVAGDIEASNKLAASDAGDFIYRFGKPSAYQQGEAPGFLDEGNQQMYGAHNIQWIKPGLPGAGNFLIFDNGVWNPTGTQSEILEINPFLDAEKKNTGFYVNPPDAGYTRRGDSNQIVWSFKASLPNSFYAQSQSGCQRLPNGNVLINSANTGHFFQVTPDGEVVWEYIQPVTRSSGIKKIQHDKDSREFEVFRCYFYPPDHPGLKGKDLTPKGKITELADRGEFDSLIKALPQQQKGGGKNRGGKKGGNKRSR